MSKMCPLYIMLSVLFGGSRLIFTDVALFGGIIMAAWGQLIYLQAVIGVIAVSLAMYASKSVKKKDATEE